MSCRSARPGDFRRVLLRRVAAVHLAENFDGPAFAERSGEGIAELLVVCFQATDAGGGRLEAAQQRGIRCALPLGRNLRRRSGRVPLAEPLDLRAQVLLGVKPGPGDASRAADGVEGDALAGGARG